MSPDPKTDHFWDEHEMSQDNAGSPELYEGDNELSERPDDVANPNEWQQYENPNCDLVDQPNSADNITDLEWMD